MWMRYAFISIVLAALSLSASALERFFPDSAKRALLSVTETEILLNGRPVKLSVGGLIFNEHNMLVQSATLIGEKNVPVNFTQNFQGEVNRVWILTDTEKAARK